MYGSFPKETVEAMNHKNAPVRVQRLEMFNVVFKLTKLDEATKLGMRSRIFTKFFKLGRYIYIRAEAVRKG